MATSSSSTPGPLKLADGHTMPHYAIGVWDMRGKETVKSLQSAVEKWGYRMIDTAQYYRNEAEVGQYVASCASGSQPIPREDLFIVTKTFTKGSGAYDSILGSLKAAKLDYWDLVLIHAPDGGKKARAETWEALSKLVKQGKVKSLGVSNYGEKHLEELSGAEVPPVVNQIECHPFFAQGAVRAACAKRNIVVQAYCPLARGNYYDDETLRSIASKRGKTPAQIMLRWELQAGQHGPGMVPLPKSSNVGRQGENWDAFAGGWSLTDEEMATLDGLDRGASGAVEVQTMSQECA